MAVERLICRLLGRLSNSHDNISLPPSTCVMRAWVMCVHARAHARPHIHTSMRGVRACVPHSDFCSAAARATGTMKSASPQTTNSGRSCSPSCRWLLKPFSEREVAYFPQTFQIYFCPSDHSWRQDKNLSKICCKSSFEK